jgi:uncharacterized protein (TIGR02001 family)
MRTFLLGATALASAMVAAPAMADDAPAAPAATPDFTITGSAGVWSQYRFRGISQSDNKPVFQGSVTLTHKSGFYLSTWGSSASAGNSTVNIGGTEIDVYGGYSHTFKGGFTLDGGAYGYIYPGASFGNYYEVYADGSYVIGPVTAKVGANFAPNQRVFDFLSGTNHNLYVYGELSYAGPAKFPFTVHTHLGHTGGGFDYTKAYIDYVGGVSYKWKALTFDVSYVGTNISRHNALVNPLFDQQGNLSPHQTYRAAKGVVVASISASF